MMVDVILSEKEVKDKKGKLIGTSRITVDTESQRFKDLHKTLSTKAAKRTALKLKGYTDADLDKIDSAGGLK